MHTKLTGIPFVIIKKNTYLRHGYNIPVIYALHCGESRYLPRLDVAIEVVGIVEMNMFFG